MPIKGTFTADFSSFNAAVEQADIKIKAFQADSAKVSTSLSNMVNAFSGQKIISDATLAAEAVNRIGGISKLTASELQRLGAIATEAAAKLKAMGQGVPEQIQKIADAAKAANTQVESTGGIFSGAFGQFTAANLAATAISKLTGELAGLVQTGLKLGAVEQSFERLTTAANVSSAQLLKGMGAATKGLVSNYDLMLSANKAMLLGLPVTATSMEELAKAATTLGRAMGQDATKSLDDLIVALGRSSPMILDNLGLSVKVGEANEAYAAKLGKTADQLTDAEKKTAFYNAAMEAARRKTEELGDQQETLVEKVQSAWTRIRNIVAGGVNKFNQEAPKALGGPGAVQGRGEEGPMAQMAEEAQEALELTRQLTDMINKLRAPATGVPIIALPPIADAFALNEALRQEQEIQRSIVNLRVEITKSVEENLAKERELITQQESGLLGLSKLEQQRTQTEMENLKKRADANTALQKQLEDGLNKQIALANQAYGQIALPTGGQSAFDAALAARDTERQRISNLQALSPDKDLSALFRQAEMNFERAAYGFFGDLEKLMGASAAVAPVTVNMTVQGVWDPATIQQLTDAISDNLMQRSQRKFPSA